MKNIYSYIKTFLFIICVMGAGIIGGVGLGITNAEATVKQHPCEQDECESHWYGDTCEDNTGNDTYCASSGDGCETKSCGHP